MDFEKPMLLLQNTQEQLVKADADRTLKAKELEEEIYRLTTQLSEANLEKNSFAERLEILQDTTPQTAQIELQVKLAVAQTKVDLNAEHFKEILSLKERHQKELSAKVDATKDVTR